MKITQEEIEKVEANVREEFELKLREFLAVVKFDSEPGGVWNFAFTVIVKKPLLPSEAQ